MASDEGKETRTMTAMPRRTFLKAGGWAVAASVAGRPALSCPRGAAELGPAFETDNIKLLGAYLGALDCLAQNTVKVFEYGEPVLIEGSVYRGVWLECAPQESQVYSAWRPDVGFSTHRIFFATQRDDGYIYCNTKMDTRGAGQIQMVVPIAATALELFERFGGNEFLELAYRSSSRWDEWLVRYRNTRGTGLCEGFVEYDTGHDHSPRWNGIPKQCPDRDARKMPAAPGIPRLCPDLSATLYGGRVALAHMARILGRRAEADRWDESAAAIRRKILEKLYVAEDAAFYDLDADDKFVRIRSDVISRVLGEHVVETKLFEEIYRRQIRNPKAFWAPYPLPSIALDDPAFVRPIPRNSWGGATQALTALRAPRWMEHYGKPADLAHLMQQWLRAIVAADGLLAQQMDPLNGKFSTEDPGGYSPAALVMADFTWRLHGVRREHHGLEWNCRLPENSRTASFTLPTPRGTAVLRHSAEESALSLAGRELLRVRGVARIVTDASGQPLRIVGTHAAPVDVMLTRPGGRRRAVKLAPDAVVKL
jgi:hypothetical protein